MEACNLSFGSHIQSPSAHRRYRNGQTCKHEMCHVQLEQTAKHMDARKTLASRPGCMRWLPRREKNKIDPKRELWVHCLCARHMQNMGGRQNKLHLQTFRQECPPSLIDRKNRKNLCRALEGTLLHSHIRKNTADDNERHP